MNTNIFKSLSKIYNYLNFKKKVEIIKILLLSIFGALLEMITILISLPFFSLVLDTKNSFNKINNYLGYLNFNTSLSSIDSYGLLKLSVFCFCLFILFSSLCRILINYKTIKFCNIVSHEIARNLYNISLNKNYLFHLKHNSNQIMNMITRQSSDISQILNYVLSIFTSLITLIFILITLLAVNFKITLCIVFIITIFYLSITFSFKNIFKQNSVISNKNQVLVFKILRESLMSINQIIINKTQSFYNRLFNSYGKKMVEANTSNQLLSLVPKYLIESFILIFLAIAIFYLKLYNTNFNNLIPLIGVFLFASLRCLPIFNLVYVSISGIISKYKSIIDIGEEFSGKKMKDKVVLSTKNVKDNPNIFKKKIELRNINFYFENKAKPLFKDLNLIINYGEKIGLHGQSGKGKTTLVNLIMGLIKPFYGKILIDNKTLDKKLLIKWHNLISYVPQESFMIDGNIYENIALGIRNEEIDKRKIDKLIEFTELQNIFNTKQKKNKNLGEFGSNLSGGEKQRVGIARALYKNFLVLILDESTNALDGKLEDKILRKILKLKNKTIIMISHKKDNYKRLNRVITL